MAPKARTNECGHPERKHRAHGMCDVCYQAWRRQDESYRKKRNAESREWQKNNLERTRETQRQWRENNRERYRKNAREWAHKNRDKCEAKQRRWRDKNAEQLRTKYREYNRTHAAEKKAKRDAFIIHVLNQYGGKCACCGETSWKFLTIDHIYSNGAEHRRQIGTRNIYRWLEKNGYPDGFQVLCWNCNSGKARNGGICPHKEAAV